MESVRGEWNGDVNLGDGRLEELKDQYQLRKVQCNTLGLAHPHTIVSVTTEVTAMRAELIDDLQFISKKYMK